MNLRKGPEVELVERLMMVRLFAGMSSEDVAKVVWRVGGGIRYYAKGRVVVFEGTKARWVVVVLSGRLTVFESGASGTRHPARVVEAGDVFGATMVTSNLEYCPGMASATEDSEVVFLDIDKIKAIWREGGHSVFFENLYSIISDEVLRCWSKMSILACKKVEDRFMLYLRWHASATGSNDVQLPFTTSEPCANYLGVTRTALSLAVKRLVDGREIAHLGHGRFVILNDVFV